MSQTPLAVPNPNTVDLANVQGDVILGFPKKKEEFVFFVIRDAAKFKRSLATLKVTTTADVVKARKDIEETKSKEGGLLSLAFLNIAFSKKGLDALGITEDLGDQPFALGQFKDAKDLGDDGVTDAQGFHPLWEKAFESRVDGVFVIAGESWLSVTAKIVEVLGTFASSIRVVYRLKGSGHEHFGWEDGISNPAVKGIGGHLPGQRVVPPGVILCGKAEDPVANRPEWALEGSFLAFRQLEQLVPEFHKFLADNPITLPGLTREQGSELLGARLVGRWKSGAPIQLSPTHDDPELAKNPDENNNFVYPQAPGDEGQTECPYAAHIRKTNPRNDLDFLERDPSRPVNAVQKSSIIRAGIPYGPEVTPDEKHTNFSEFHRGLAFVSYQSSLSKGFQFIQKSWANAPNFPPVAQKKVEAGFDPIIGQKNGQSRETLGTSAGSQLTLPRDFVISRGGEYFFSPSIKALKTKFAGSPLHALDLYFIRAGIPYGPEVSLNEKHENHTEHSRGLAFISYRGSLAEGFQFLQISWANNTRFLPQKQVTPGFDPIVGQNNGQARESLGSEAGSQLTLPRDFVVSRGGEHFFSPSINTLKTKFAGLSTARTARISIYCV
ncbi:Peroxidase 2 Short=MsP2 [Rhizoctonia solani AG-1 IB]|uniref:Peroxidase 2 Short=MsP2 n=1 Tax=Thanatephorus cucumeris (strain AG1-IB / isolate 7/3/14) TaxID=1108050 RepID=M5C8U8_THACB|nr:Peroxidase 2 Short=MsP2 [Rhizoctonia solani AG-1 IB]